MALENLGMTRPPADLFEMELLNHCVCHKTSFLAAAEFEEDHELRAYSSAAHEGMWYLGVVEDGVPPYRDSQYFPTEEAAREALLNRNWEQRMDP
jgi:hypothetical protein